MSFEKLKNKKTILCLMAIALISVAGYVSANDIVGNVDVITPRMTLSDLVIPTNVNAGEEFQIEFDMTDLNEFVNLDYMLFTFWRTGYEGVIDNTTIGVRGYQQDNDAWGKTPATGWSLIGTPYAEWNGVGQNAHYVLNVSLGVDALAGEWNAKMQCFETTGDNHSITGKMTMNTYYQLSILESSFSFGSVQQGMVDIEITDPMSGYLTIDLISNAEAKLQVSGTDPTKGEDSFSVSNIKIYDADLVGSASSLTGELADLNGDSYIGSEVAYVYLWISVPAGTPIGTYTFTLSIVLVAL